MLRPAGNATTTTVVENGWVKNTEEGTRPSSKRVNQWFMNNATITFDYEGQSINGRIAKYDFDYRTRFTTITVGEQQFNVHKIGKFKVEYSSEPVPREISVENGKVRKTFVEAKDGAPTLAKMEFFLKNGLEIAIRANPLEKGSPVRQEKGILERSNPNDAFPHVFFLKGVNAGFRLRDIQHYQACYDVTGQYPYLLDSTMASRPDVQAVELTAGSKKFVVNFKRLCERVPYLETITNFDLSSILSADQLELLLKLLDGKIKVTQYNAFEFYYIAAVLKFDALKAGAFIKAQNYLIRHATKQEIDFLRSDHANPILKELLNGLGKKIFSFNSGRTIFPWCNTLNTYFWRLENPWNHVDQFENFTVLSHISTIDLDLRRQMVKGLSDYHLSHGVLEVIRVVEILGGTTETVILREARDVDLPLLCAGLKGKAIKNFSLSSALPYKNERKGERNLLGITDRGVEQIVPLLESLQSLETVEFTNHNFGDEGVKLLSQYIQHNKTLKGFSLCTPCTSTGLDYFCQSLIGSNVEVLNLDRAGIGKYQDLSPNTPWVQILAANKKLEVLGLRENHLDDQNLDAIIYIIEHSQSLKTIDLFANPGITEKGKAKLIAALNKNPSITECFISNALGDLLNLAATNKSSV